MSDDPGAIPQAGARTKVEGISFPAFVISLVRTAAVHFGDVPDPATGAKGQPNLPAAQQMIDILALLELKTRGNLTPEEGQLIEQVLYELHQRLVEGQGVAGDSGPRIILP
jgi:hypothetical protein